MRGENKGVLKRRVVILVTSVVLVVVFSLLAYYSFLYCIHKQYYPNEGIWYCEEIQTQINFSPPEGTVYLDNDQSGTYVVKDDNKIACSIIAYPGSPQIIIGCQDTTNPNYDVGKAIYILTYESLTDETYVVKDKSGNVYTFVRVEQLT